MGEGENKLVDMLEMIEYSTYSHKKGLKTALYSGRNIEIEEWMWVFDYIKLGEYSIEKGALTEKSTNQVLFQKEGHEYFDITCLFWR